MYRYIFIYIYIYICIYRGTENIHINHTQLASNQIAETTADGNEVMLIAHVIYTYTYIYIQIFIYTYMIYACVYAYIHTCR